MNIPVEFDAREEDEESRHGREIQILFPGFSAATTDTRSLVHMTAQFDFSYTEDTYNAFYYFLEKRIRGHPEEARERDTDGYLPIQRLVSANRRSFRLPPPPPPSLLQCLIDAHPHGAMEMVHGQALLMHAMHTWNLNYWESFVVLLDANSEAVRIPADQGRIPLHAYLYRKAFGSIHICWSLLQEYPEGAGVVDDRGRDALYFLSMNECNRRPAFTQDCLIPHFHSDCDWAQAFLVKLARDYNQVPEMPQDDDAIMAFESHPSIKQIAAAMPLPENRRHLLLNVALQAKCPWLLFDFLASSFPRQMVATDPDLGPRRPVETAMFNLVSSRRNGNDDDNAPLHQLRMVYVLLLNDPGYVEENIQLDQLE